MERLGAILEDSLVDILKSKQSITTKLRLKNCIIYIHSEIKKDSESQYYYTLYHLKKDDDKNVFYVLSLVFSDFKDSFKELSILKKRAYNISGGWYYPHKCFTNKPQKNIDIND